MLNSFHKNIQFTYEVESNAKLRFLDVLLMRNDEDITTTVYQKEKEVIQIIFTLGLFHIYIMEERDTENFS